MDSLSIKLLAQTLRHKLGCQIEDTTTWFSINLSLHLVSVRFGDIPHHVTTKERSKQPQPQVCFQGVVGRATVVTLQRSDFREGAAAYLRYKAELSLILLRVLVLANCSSRIFVY
jgi:hypothetical protein